MEDKNISQPISTETSPITQKVSTNQSKHRNTKVIVVAFLIVLILLIAVLAGAYVFSKNSSQSTPTPNPDEGAVACTMEAKLCPDGVTYVGRSGPKCEFEACPTESTSTSSAKIKSFTSKKVDDLGFKGYSLNYPESWILSEIRTGAPSPSSSVSLTKGTYVIYIRQIATDGGGCIFKGDVPEGPFGDYRNSKYSDINSGFALLRQVESPDNGKMNYFYCQKTTEDSWGKPTGVGIIDITTSVAQPDSNMLAEIKKIIESIRIN